MPARNKKKKSSSKDNHPPPPPPPPLNSPPLISDPRFSSAFSRPQFLPTKKSQHKLKLDSRFSAILTDPRFRSSSAPVDKYGRILDSNAPTTAREELSRFYELQDDDEEKKEKEKDMAAAPGKKIDMDERHAYLVALSRGEVSASDDDDDSSSSSSSDDDTLHHSLLLPSQQPNNDSHDNNIIITSESSPYLAICNLDWDHVRAVDLFAILSSFAPPGTVREVAIYMSDFGMERMEREMKVGPEGIFLDEEEDEEDGKKKKKKKKRVEDRLREDDTQFDVEKLRLYEASKLKYYFSIATFSTPEAADSVYSSLDGLEFEHSSSSFDLRSIPPSDLPSIINHNNNNNNNQKQQKRPLKDKATSLPGNYTPVDFVVKALQTTNVKCTWEEGDVEREKKLTRYGVGREAWEAMLEGDDLKAYVASASESSDDDSDDDDNDGEGLAVAGGDEADKVDKMRRLFGLEVDDDDDDDDEADHDEGSKKKKQSSDQGDKEISFIPGQSQSLAQKIRDKVESYRDTTTSSSSTTAKDELTPFEKYQLKRKEKRREKRRAIKERRKQELEERDGMRSGGKHDDDDDGFFVKKKKDKLLNEEMLHGNENDLEDDKSDDSEQQKTKVSSREELELLLAGDEDLENTKDYSLRSLIKTSKMKNSDPSKLSKRLKRKRNQILQQQPQSQQQLPKTCNNYISNDNNSSSFRFNTADSRFQSMMNGSDDRFGIDVTDSLYKDTDGMKEVLRLQRERRKERRQKQQRQVMSKGGGGGGSDGTGKEDDVSLMVKRIKQNVGGRG